MEVIKEIDKMKFYVTYADGTRRQVVLSTAAMELAAFFARQTPLLRALPGIDQIISDPSNIVAVVRSGYGKPNQIDHSEKQAVFQLGQMEMQQSVAAMLTVEADSVSGVIRSTLLDAAERVRQMEVLK